ncbi:hypothetical protein BU25DRAFT_344775, partial [Macroventuria anomochaeta]
KHSHSHIQIVPRTDHQIAASSSYSFSHQHPIKNSAGLPVDQQDRAEKMAYRPHQDDEFEDDQTDHGSVFLAGIIKLQPGRRKRNKTWRPMHASDLGEPGSVDGARVHLFGSLPDPIRLSEQMGKFDGQVVFIGHPNRDISAHQWSSSSFQWVNIGRYSHSRGKVEGSLASDRLRGIDEPHDTLEYFKLAAENRQTLIIENGRSKDNTTTAGRALHVGTDIVASTQTYTDTSTKGFRAAATTQSETRSSIPSTARVPFAKDVLEDPFVAAINAFSSQFTDGNQRTAVFNSTTRYAVSTRSAVPATYTTSSLSATAMPYANATTAAADSDASESNASTVNAATVGLHYSDPDGLRRTQQYEVANGLNQQAPTPQSFKGPFFTESKPTTHDPTVALSVRVGEEEKLVNWFRDGHRPARQKEYTKSLIAAAAASDKTRNFGAVGEVSAKQERGPYANTAPFVRLYENLSEYVEEYRNGSGQSYFTRRWKPAVQQLRELGSDNSTSYFSKGSTQPSWSRAALLRPLERMWS